jgi:hypothetical protein
VTLDRTLPPRFVWHITWDQLDAAGHQPAFGAVAGYLQDHEWCPHIMWNPFTGYMEQYYPASVGGRALMYNDQDGEACVQVEVFFTPDCIVDGVRYDTVADTPLKGFDKILAWADSLGVPRTWPMGAPQWQGNARDVDVWNNNAGHYGHCHSPGDTHTDPGPMPSLKRAPAPTPQKETEVPAYTRITTPYNHRRLAKGRTWNMVDATNKATQNFAVLGLGYYDIDLFLSGTDLPEGETITVQFAVIPTGGKPSGYFKEEIHGSADGTFKGRARFKMPVLSPALVEATITSSHESAYIDQYAAEVYAWKAN